MIGGHGYQDTNEYKGKEQGVGSRKSVRRAC